MTIDELIMKVRSISSEKEVSRLADLIGRWKNDDTTVEDLCNAVEQYLNNTWMVDSDYNRKICSIWEAFKSEAVSGLDGMTMNERLHFFSLHKRFDDCWRRKSKFVIYRKLHANP